MFLIFRNMRQYFNKSDQQIHCIQKKKIPNSLYTVRDFSLRRYCAFANLIYLSLYYKYGVICDIKS